MRWKRPHHTRWLAACVLALLISTLAGGVSFRVAIVFVIIFLVGAALLNLDDPDDDDFDYDYPIHRSGAEVQPAAPAEADAPAEESAAEESDAEESDADSVTEEAPEGTTPVAGGA